MKKMEAGADRRVEKQTWSKEKGVSAGTVIYF